MDSQQNSALTGDTPRLLARDDGLWVFDKPAGMPVHPAPGHKGELDLLTWARQEAGAGSALGLVHRLDRATSGVVLGAEDPAIRAEVSAWFAAGEVGKEYLALVYGRAPAEGIIDRPLHDDRRKRHIPATTHYECVQCFRDVSLLSVVPQTGRKHQIRRHLRGAGHPIVGDERYGPGRRAPVPGFPGRLWLHAHRLVLPDGREFVSPLPDRLEAHLALLAEL